VVGANVGRWGAVATAWGAGGTAASPVDGVRERGYWERGRAALQRACGGRGRDGDHHVECEASGVRGRRELEDENPPDTAEQMTSGAR
jgi:hypothetical protein